MLRSAAIVQLCGYVRTSIIILLPGHLRLRPVAQVDKRTRVLELPCVNCPLLGRSTERRSNRTFEVGVPFCGGCAAAWIVGARRPAGGRAVEPCMSNRRT